MILQSRQVRVAGYQLAQAVVPEPHGELQVMARAVMALDLALAENLVIHVDSDGYVVQNSPALVGQARQPIGAYQGGR